MAISLTLKDGVERVAKSLGCLKAGVVTLVTDAKTFEILRFKDYFPTDKGPEDWWLWAGAEWHRINTWSASTGVMVTVDNFVAVPLVGDSVQVYKLLSPEEWREAANDSLAALWYEDRITTPLEGDKNLYSLAAVTWLQSKQQLIRFLWRDSSGGAVNIDEPSVAFLRPVEQGNIISLYIPVMPMITGLSGTLNVITVAKHYYDRLQNEVAATTCPEPLFTQAAKFESLLRIFQRMPTKAKADFGRDLILTERELARLKAHFIPEATYEDMREEEPWSGADFGDIPLSWSW